jgi:CheY-like chemotaxis protein
MQTKSNGSLSNKACLNMVTASAPSVAKSLEDLTVKFGGNLECVYDSVELLKTVAAKQKFDVIFIDVSITELIRDLLNEILKYSTDLKIVLLVKLNELGSKSFKQKHPLVKAVIVKPVHELNFIETFASFFPNENYLEKKMISSKQDCFEKGTSVLLAEDNYYNRMLVRSLLEGCGIELVEVVNGAEAVEQFKVRAFSIVLMDVKMPVMDGVEAIGRIRSYEKEKQLHRTPVVAFTANVFKEDIDSYFKAGFDSTLSKPASYSQLIDVFREYCFKKGGEDTSAPSLADMKISKLKLEFYEYVIEGCERILNSLIPSGDWDTVFSIAHDWKGTGTGYGYQDVTTVGDEVCLFIREGKVEQVAAVLEDFLLSHKEKRP